MARLPRDPSASTDGPTRFGCVRAPRRRTDAARRGGGLGVRFATTVGCTAALLLGGCALKRPRIAVEDLRVEEIGQTGARLALDLELTNASDVPIRLEEWDWSIRFDRERGPSLTPVDQAVTDGVRRLLDPSRPAWRGRWQALRTLPAASTVRVTLPAAIDARDLELLVRLRDGAALPWIVDGSVTFSSDQRIARILFDADLYQPSQPFAGTGAAVERAADAVIGPLPLPRTPSDATPTDPAASAAAPLTEIETPARMPGPDVVEVTEPADDG